MDFEPVVVAFDCGFDRLYCRSLLPFPIKQDVGFPVQSDRLRQSGCTVCYDRYRMLANHVGSRKTFSFNDHFKHSTREADRCAPCLARRLCLVALLCFRFKEEVYCFPARSSGIMRRNV